MNSIPSLGIPAIDAEHEHLFNLVAEMQMALAKDDALVAYAQARALVESALSHLKHEEVLLTDWEGKAGHLECHRRFETSLDHFFRRYPNLAAIQGPAALDDLNALALYSEGWLNYHIKFEDLQFSDFLKAKGCQ